MERRLVVVDPGLYGHAEWLRQVELTGSSLLSLQPDLDGPQQIADFLSASAAPYDSLHLLSHGSPGMLHVGASLLSASNLDLFRPVLAQIGAGLAADGDILIYGCELASGEVGRQFIEALAEATSADVAASAEPVSGKSLSVVDASDDAITESEQSLLAAPLLEQRVGSVESSPLSLTGLGVLGVNTAPGFAWATGKVTASPGIDDLATVVLQQADGKIIIAGTSTYRWSNSFGSGISTQFAITRYNANGTQDGTFVGDYSGDPDRALETTGFTNGSGDTALQQASGPVIFAGKTAGNLALLRLTSTGAELVPAALRQSGHAVAVLRGDVDGSWSAPDGSDILPFDYYQALVEIPDTTLTLAQFGIAAVPAV